MTLGSSVTTGLDQLLEQRKYRGENQEQEKRDMEGERERK